MTLDLPLIGGLDHSQNKCIFSTGRRSDIGVFRLAPELSEHIMTWPDNYHLLGDKGFRLMKAS